jgi:hypothetical protein
MIEKGRLPLLAGVAFMSVAAAASGASGAVTAGGAIARLEAGPSSASKPTPTPEPYVGNLPTATVTPAAATPSPAASAPPVPTPSATLRTSPAPPSEPLPTSGPPPPSGGTCPTPVSAGDFPVSYFEPTFTLNGAPLTKTQSPEYITDDGSYVEVCYPAGSSVKGVGGRLYFSDVPQQTATLTYEIRFPVGFQWGDTATDGAGKLPGLCGGGCNDGGPPGGWSARFMWRPGGAGAVLLDNETHVLRGNWFFSADGRWHTLSETVNMNTPGQPNGVLTVTYDGVQVGQITNAEYRDSGDTDGVDSMFFSSFFGGGCVTPTTQSVDFADFAVTG